VDGELIVSADDVASAKDNVIIELAIIQAKKSAGFAEAPIHSLVSTVGDLLNMETSLESLSIIYL
jgi:hypothetical protein